MMIDGQTTFGGPIDRRGVRRRDATNTMTSNKLTHAS